MSVRVQSHPLTTHGLVVAGRNIPVIAHHLQFETQEVELISGFAVPSIAEGAVARPAEDVWNLFSAPDRVLDDVFP